VRSVVDSRIDAWLEKEMDLPFLIWACCDQGKDRTRRNAPSALHAHDIEVFWTASKPKVRFNHIKCTP